MNWIELKQNELNCVVLSNLENRQDQMSLSLGPFLASPVPSCPSSRASPPSKPIQSESSASRHDKAGIESRNGPWLFHLTHSLIRALLDLRVALKPWHTWKRQAMGWHTRYSNSLIAFLASWLLLVLLLFFLLSLHSSTFPSPLSLFWFLFHFIQMSKVTPTACFIKRHFDHDWQCDPSSCLERDTKVKKNIR